MTKQRAESLGAQLKRRRESRGTHNTVGYDGASWNAALSVLLSTSFESGIDMRSKSRRGE